MYQCVCHVWLYFVPAMIWWGRSLGPTSSCHGILYTRYYRLVGTFSSKPPGGSRGVVLLSPRIWKGCQRLGTRDWYLMHFSNPSVTEGQKHTHTHTYFVLGGFILSSFLWFTNTRFKSLCLLVSTFSLHQCSETAIQFCLWLHFEFLLTFIIK